MFIGVCKKKERGKRLKLLLFYFLFLLLYFKHLLTRSYTHLAPPSLLFLFEELYECFDNRMDVVLHFTSRLS